MLIHDKFGIALVNIELVICTSSSANMADIKKSEITGVKKYSKDLEQGGLEIPARLIISNAKKRITDVMKKKLNFLVEE